MERLCSKCGGATVEARPHIPVTGDLTAFKEPVKAIGVNTKITFTMTVCTNCGFTELYAKDPQGLQGK